MSVRKDVKRGRWIADFYDQTGKRHAPTFPTRRAALDALAEARGRIQRRTYRGPRDVPKLTAVATEWLESKRDRRPSTLVQWETHVHRHILPALGGVRLNDLDVALVENFRDGRRAAGLKAQTVNKLLTTLAAITTFANRRGYVVGNAAALAERLRLGASAIALETAGGEDGATGGDALSADPDQVLAPDEIRRLLQQAAPGFARTAVMVAVLTGIRAGELLALRWADVVLDGAAPLLRVRHTLSRAKTKAERLRSSARFYEPKTKHSRRSVGLPGVLVRQLRTWKLACPPSRFGLVFPTPAGDPGHRSALRAALRSALKGAGLRFVTWHSLRHVAASGWIAEGAPVTEVQRRLGHSSPAVTLRVYAHWFEGLESDAAERFATLVCTDDGDARRDSSKVAAADAGVRVQNGLTG